MKDARETWRQLVDSCSPTFYSYCDFLSTGMLETVSGKRFYVTTGVSHEGLIITRLFLFFWIRKLCIRWEHVIQIVEFVPDEDDRVDDEIMARLFLDSEEFPIIAIPWSIEFRDYVPEELSLEQVRE